MKHNFPRIIVENISERFQLNFTFIEQEVLEWTDYIMICTSEDVYQFMFA